MTKVQCLILAVMCSMVAACWPNEEVKHHPGDGVGPTPTPPPEDQEGKPAVPPEGVGDEKLPSLAQAYQDFFTVGAAVTSQRLAKDGAFIAKHFNRLVAEWEMKWGPVQRIEGEFDFRGADKIVDFAAANGMRVTGHTLIWHLDTPRWVFYDENGKLVSKELLSARMRAHIFQVMSRYKGKIDNWDVANEVLSDNPDEVYRQSEFYKIYGSEEYVAQAYLWAAEADPDVELWYNDYCLVLPDKLPKALQLIRFLKSRGVKLTGVGLQGHYNIYWPPKAQVQAAIQQILAEGVKVKISELDLTIYNDYATGKFVGEPEKDFTAEIDSQQAFQYGRLFELFRELKGQMAHVTLWGVADDSTWLDTMVPGRKDHPLLFNEKLQPKKAFFNVVNFR